MSTAPSLDEILALAKSLPVLKEDQLSRILTLAPKMDAAALTRLKVQLDKIKSVYLKDLKQKTEVLHHAAAAHKEWQADKARDALHEAESADLAASQETASHLLSSLNN